MGYEVRTYYYFGQNFEEKLTNINTTIVPPPLCVYPIIDPSSSSGSSSTAPDDILNMIENLPPEIKYQIKTLTLEARSKKIIRVLHNYLKEHQSHILAIYPDIDQPWKTSFAFLGNQLDGHTLSLHVVFIQ